MLEDNIFNVRRRYIKEIKDKIKKNPRYIHPMNKERQIDEKKLKFDNGYEFTCWMQQNGILNTPARARDKYFQDKGFKNRKEYQDKLSQKAGFKNSSDQRKEWTHKTGRNLSIDENPNCPAYFGNFIAENYIIRTFEDAEKMPYGNPGFDWKCKKGEKIDNKARCLEYSNQSNWNGWTFHIRYNNIADWFILSAWDNRNSLNPLHIWVFHKNEIRDREFWRRENFSITNSQKGLKEFEKYEVTDRLAKLQEFCKNKSIRSPKIYN